MAREEGNSGSVNFDNIFYFLATNGAEWFGAVDEIGCACVTQAHVTTRVEHTVGRKVEANGAFGRIGWGF